MKKIVSALLVAGLLVILLVVGGTGRHRVINVQNEPEQITGEKEDKGSAGEADGKTNENGAETKENTEDTSDHLKIGVLLIGDETENYSRAHIEGIAQAAEAIGIMGDEIEWKERIDNSDDSYDAVEELLDDGCNLLIANSSVQQDALLDAAENHPEAKFVVIGGDKAAVSGLDNYYNAYTDIYEARYLSGVVAGMKIAQLDRKGKISKYGYDESGKVRVGYIGTYPNAEVISGYSAFYLGMKSVMKNVVLEVYYTNSRLDMDAEATAADKLIRSGCVLIAQHGNSDSAASTIEKAWKSGRYVYYVGCNTDMSETAPNATLTSVVSNWDVYYTQLFTAVEEEKEFPHDWSQGLSEGAVSLTKLSAYAAPKTAAKIKKVREKIESDKLHVFDISKFTVGGMWISDQDAMIDLSLTDETEDTEASEDDIIKSALTSYDKGVYFAESTLRSAPYFDLHIDGIEEVNKTEE